MRTILLLPLSNVLGHLTRTFALAEEFDAQGHRVFVAADPTYRALAKLLPPHIRVLPTPEMDPAAARSFGPISHYRRGTLEDRENLENSSRLTPSELRLRGQRMATMVERDSAIVEAVRPDAIITDYRFTPSLFKLSKDTALFHVSHVLGYPSFFRRVIQTDFFPLDAGHILVPGISEIEYGDDATPCKNPQRRESLCGPFRWDGWARLHRGCARPPRAHIFLFFGSTGNSEGIVPHLLRTLAERYAVSAIAPDLGEDAGRPGAHVVASGNIESFLDSADMVFCHGGHGTVMECIIHRKPMVIFPHNIEQLEIGIAIEKMGLGILMKRPFRELSSAALEEAIDRVAADDRIATRLETYSARLIREDGTKKAVSTVLRSLADRDDLAFAHARR